MMEKQNVNNITFKDFPYICRICLSNMNLKPFHQFCHLIKLFENITNIQIELAVSLPNNVCTSCVDQLENISSFINTSKINDVNLKQIISENKLEFFTEDSSLDSCGADSQASKDFDADVKIKSEHNTEIIDNEIVLQVNQNRKQIKKLSKQSVESKSLNCDVCEDNFNTKKGLVDHQKTSINCKMKQFKCIHCEKTFLTKCKLKLHVRSHTKESPFECNICHKKFTQSSNLKRHDDTVHKHLKPFKCDVCGKEYSRLATKNEHMNSHSGDLPYTCIYCGKSFRTYSNHLYHMYSHKVENDEIEKSDEKKNGISISELACKICNKIFSSKSGFLQHLMLHGDRKFLCPICGKSFFRKQQLEDHSRLHSGEKPHECKYCGKSFRLISGYKNHVRIHTGEKPHHCKICKKSFVQSIHLKNHMRIHTGEKPYQCAFCGKCFTEKCNWKVHTRIHTGETPYHCSVCSMGFYDSSNMKKHENGHLFDKNKII